MERSHPSSGRSATPADINRNGRPTSFGTGGRHQSECPADIIGIRIHYRVDPLDPGVDPALDRAEEIDPVRGGAALVCFRKCIPCGRSESTEDVALAASAVVDLLLGPLRFGTGRLDHAPAGIAPGGLRSHLVEADD